MPELRVYTNDRNEDECLITIEIPDKAGLVALGTITCDQQLG
jgi:hypothetical protein